MKSTENKIFEGLGMFGMFGTIGMVIFAICFVACKATPQAPDPSLFPKESQDWNNGYGAGFKKGFHEGLVYNALSQ